MSELESAERIAERLGGDDPDTPVFCLHCEGRFTAGTPGRILNWTLGDDGPVAIGCPGRDGTCSGYPEIDWMPLHG